MLPVEPEPGAVEDVIAVLAPGQTVDQHNQGSSRLICRPVEHGEHDVAGPVVGGKLQPA